MIKEDHQKAIINTEYTFKGFCDTPGFEIWNKMISKKIEAGDRGLWKDLRLTQIKEEKYHNVICKVGISRLMAGLVGKNANLEDMAINYCALGDGTGTPNTNDTTLFNEVYRNTIASGEYASNQINITAFYTQSETSGTYKEFGTFIEGTASADTGAIFGKLGPVTWTKSTSDYLLVDVRYTIEDDGV